MHTVSFQNICTFFFNLNFQTLPIKKLKLSQNLISGCHGGNEDQIYQYSRSHGGCASESAYPYRALVIDPKCENHGARVNHSKVVDWKTMRSESEIYNAVNKLGPVSIGMDVHLSFMSYRHDIYRTKGPKDRKVGAHAVVVVGYGEKNGQKYWIVRNSWGE